MKTDPDSLQRLADKCAEDAYENRWPTRRELFPFDDLDLLCYFDNNPFASDATRRPRFLAALTDALEREGFPVASRSRYPKEGNDAAFTEALLISAKKRDFDRVKEIVDGTLAPFCAEDERKREAAGRLKWTPFFGPPPHLETGQLRDGRSCTWGRRI